MPPEPRYPLVVFDWDGTLIDSASAIVDCIQEAAREMGLQVPGRDRASHVIGLGLRDSLRYAVPDLPQEQYGAFAERYRRNFTAREDRMDLFPGVLEMLAGLESTGHLLAIATGKSRRGLDRSLQATGLTARFAATRCGDESASKPHPAMLHGLMQELRVDSAGTLMVGDTSHDLVMARNAGVDAVAVTYGAHTAESLRTLDPRGCVDSVAELASWLTANA